MRAIVITRPGGPEVLELRDVPTPMPARGEARVRVRATAVNRADLLQRMGAYPAPPDVPRDIPGLELAGEIDALGEGVTGLAVGDRVFGLVGGGAYAEHVVTHARTLVKMPDTLSFVEGAAVPRRGAASARPPSRSRAPSAPSRSARRAPRTSSIARARWGSPRPSPSRTDPSPPRSTRPAAGAASTWSSSWSVAPTSRRT
jgi:D-arabinose 1-dehydrogenase-like Zn-dependent alcohol dehydrogenase